MSENNTELKLVDTISQELTKNNLTEAMLAEIEKNFLPLTLKGMDDKDGYKAIKDARLKCKQLRVLTTRVCKEGREEAILVQKKWITEEKKITERLSKVETHLQEQEDAYDAHKEKIKKEKKEAEQKRVHDRIQRVINAGFAFDGIKYTIGDVIITASDVPYCNDEVFEDTIQKGLVEAERLAEAKRQEEERIAKEREERERSQKEEEERMAAERAELEKQRLEQEAKEKKMREEEERIAKEKEEMRKQRYSIRSAALKSAGFGYIGDLFILRELSIKDTALYDFDTDQWVDLLRPMNPRIAEIQMEIADKEAADRAEAERLRQESLKPDKEKLLEYAHQLGAIAPPAVSSKEAADRAEAERLRQESLKPDKEKLLEYAHQLGAIAPPAVSSKEATDLLAKALLMLVGVQEFITNNTKSL